MRKVFFNGIFVVIGETNSPDCIWMVNAQVTYIPFGLDFLGGGLKKEPHIGDMEIILSLRI